MSREPFFCCDCGWGGDAAAVVALAGCTSQISHVSTGGGASLEFLEKGSLPGTEILSPAQS